MVVGDFNFEGVAFVPNEADAPLLIDADAVLSCPVSTKCLKVIARWNAEVIQCRCEVKHGEFVEGSTQQIGREAAAFTVP